MSTITKPSLSEMTSAEYLSEMLQQADQAEPLSEQAKAALYGYGHAYAEMGLLDLSHFYELTARIGLTKDEMNNLPI